MADVIQFRRDTVERWAEFNPTLAEGEIGFILDSTNNYKVGDGIHAWNELPLKGFNGNIEDKLGDHYDSVISQGGITDVLKYIVSNKSKIDVSEGWGVLDEQGKDLGTALNSCGLYVLMYEDRPTYHMLVTSDNMTHGITQWVFGNIFIENDELTRRTHNDDAVRIVYRSIYWSGSIPAVNRGVWTKWQYFQSDFISNDENTKSKLDETNMVPSLKLFKDSIKEIKPRFITNKEFEDLADKNELDEKQIYFVYSTDE